MKIIIFDYDGTIHDTTELFWPAFQLAFNTFVENGKLAPAEWTKADVASWIGHSREVMLNAATPDLSEEEQEEFSVIMRTEVRRLTGVGKAMLFEGMEETLAELKKRGYYLMIMSNCKDYYLERHRRVFDLDRFFDAYYCTRDYEGLEKFEIFEQIIKKEHEGEFYIIGDRRQDIEVGLKCGIPSVGAVYGCGAMEEFEGATWLVNKPIELLDIFK